MQKKNDWKSQCYIIEYSDSTFLAVQKNSESLGKMSFDAAENIANGSRLGNFSDWRLPGFKEMNVIATNLLNKDSLHKSYWFIDFFENNHAKCKVYENYVGKDCTDMEKQENHHDFFVIRHFYKNNERKTIHLPKRETMTVTSTRITYSH